MQYSEKANKSENSIFFVNSKTSLICFLLRFLFFRDIISSTSHDSILQINCKSIELYMSISCLLLANNAREKNICQITSHKTKHCFQNFCKQREKFQTTLILHENLKVVQPPLNFYVILSQIFNSLEKLY